MQCVDTETQKHIDYLLTSDLHKPTAELLAKCRADDAWAQDALEKQRVQTMDVNLVLHIMQYNRSNSKAATEILAKWIARANEE